MFTKRTLAAIATGSLLVASCGGSSDDASPSPSPATATEPAAAPAPTAPATTDDPGSESDGADSSTAAVPAALQFTAPLVGGGEIDAATLADKPTVFWFWAPT